MSSEHAPDADPAEAPAKGELPSRDADRLRFESSILRAIGDASPLGIYVVEARTERILYFNDVGSPGTELEFAL